MPSFLAGNFLFLFPICSKGKHIFLTFIPLPSPSPSPDRFVCSQPNKHPSWPGFCFASPYQSAPEPGWFLHPQLPPVGSGSCLCSAKELTLAPRWRERFVKLRQIQIKQRIRGSHWSTCQCGLPPGSWKEAAALDKSWCSPEHGQGRIGPKGKRCGSRLTSCCKENPGCKVT